MYSYVGKMLFVNLTDKTYEVKPLEEKMAKDFLGGPALGARILYEHMPANADVFGPESMVGFIAGPMNNTGAYFGGRYTVVSKSPVTGGWNDANSGGYFGQTLKRAGYDAVFVNGISEKPVYIYIEDSRVEFHDASDLWGMTSSKLEEALKEKHGNKIRAAYIGPAGEHMSFTSCVMNDEHRAAGRGGTGAVVGSKKLKAIVVKGDAKTDVYDKAAITAINKENIDNLNGPAVKIKASVGVVGTGAGYQYQVLTGDSGIKNWSGAGVVDFPEEVAKPLSGPGLEPFKTKKYACSACPLGCGAFLNVPHEKYDLKNTSRPEYETMSAFGGLLLNRDAPTMLFCNQICNEYGMDTMAVGPTIAWAMECYNEGVLSREELDGIDLTWGNSDAIAELCEKIGKAEGVGAVLANGSRDAARHFGKGEEFLVTASGIEQPQHDSRMANPLARTYKYDPTPGRHVKGGPRMAPPWLKFDNIAEHDKQGTTTAEIINSAGFCCIGQAPTAPNSFQRYINAATGFNYSDEEYYNLGIRMFFMRHAFNLREGMNRKSYTLPKRFTQAQPPFDGPLKDVNFDVEVQADAYFDIMRMDKETLIPEKAYLEELGGLDFLFEDLYGTA